VDLFWRARYLRRQGAQGTWQKAAELLEQAVRVDPRYAQAWSALASTQAARIFHTGAALDPLAAQARLAAEKTLALDPADPNALLALAQLEWIGARNWPAAERQFRLVVERNPGFAAGHGWFATALMARGRFDEALAELARASRLDPYSYLVSNDEATILYCARRYGQAIARARKTIEIEPQFIYARVVLGACESARGRYAEALREFQPVLERSRLDVLGRMGHALARSGRRGEAEALLRELESEGAQGNSRVQAAFVRAGLGDSAGALDDLEAAFARRETDLNYLAVEPVLAPLHAEPRFQALRKRMGL
jgi:tetratricopeptide (TPR) repeat protein